MLLLGFTTFSGSHRVLPLAKHKSPSPLLFAILITHVPLIAKSSQFPKQAVLVGVSVCFHMLSPMPGVNLSFLLCPVNSSSFLEFNRHHLLEAFSDPPRKWSHSFPIFMHLYLFPVATLSNCPKLVGLKQEECIISWFQRPESEIKESAEVCSPWRLGRAFVPCLSVSFWSCWKSLVFFGLYVHHPNLYFHIPRPSQCLSVSFPLSLTEFRALHPVYSHLNPTINMVSIKDPISK